MLFFLKMLHENLLITVVFRCSRKELLGLWQLPYCCMATATQLYGYRHTVVWLPPKGKDFEVYVDYHDDGSFTVYYRLVK